MASSFRIKGAGPKPCTSDPIQPTEDKRLPVVLCKKRDLVRSVKQLIGKWAYEPEIFNADDVFCLMELYLRMVEYAEKDYNWRIWILPLKEMEPIMSRLRPNPKISVQKESLLRLEAPAVWMIPDKFAYYGEKFQDRPSWKLILRVPRVERIPPKRWIGVGYKDKGYLPHNSWNASPSWKEVTADRRSSTRRIGYTEAYNVSSNPPSGIFYPQGAITRPGKSLSYTVAVKGRTTTTVL